MQIEVSHLVKEYKRKKNPGSMLKAAVQMFHPQYETLRAVNDINFGIKKGEAVGYVGPNGCGKSTTIKMLSGVLTPTEGKVLVDGMEPAKNRKKINKKTGIVFGNRSVLWWDVPIIESYKVLQKLYEIPEKRFQENLEEFADIIGIRQLLGVPERQLSLGQKMRCNIAAAFLHDPQIVYLDEPTIGLDSESKLKIREFIRQMNEERHTTFIVTSHDFQDIESLCKRIILINHGEVVVDDGIQKIQKKYQSKKQIRFEMDQNPWIETEKFTMDGVTILDKSPYSLVLECEIQKVNAMAVVDYVSRSCQILDISIQGQDIESIIREIVTEKR
nr:ATP-binding cassette domain-containing protein [uncultured Merdimonas sp.]